MWWTLWLLVLCAALVDAYSAHAAGLEVPGPQALQARYTTLRDRLQANEFARPLTLDSRQLPGELDGEVHAVVDHPFDAVGAMVRSAAQWCEILTLHINVKQCRVESDAQGEMLVTQVGNKRATSLDDTHRIAFRYQASVAGPDYVQIRLDAAAGPFGTRDYRIVLEAIPLDAGHSFVHLSYSYRYGVTAALAMRAYFSTAAAGKIGFTVVGTRPDGERVRVGDIRGALERNTMRYFLAFDACLAARSAPPPARLEQRLLTWFDATERYAPQLHELGRDEYLDMKRVDLGGMLAQR